MRGLASKVELHRPANLDEALALLAAEEGWRPIAGGTDLFVEHESGRLGPARLLAISRLPELVGVRQTRTGWVIGAGTSWSSIRDHAGLKEDCPMLCQAAALTGAAAIQNRGTIGGNLANASPAADGPPVLLACGASLRLRSLHGTRDLPLDEFFLGYKKLALQPGELIEAVLLPRRVSGELDHHRKVGARRAQAISKLALAVRGSFDPGGVFRCRIGVASVAPVPLRARRTEGLLASGPLDAARAREARRSLMAEIAPIDDLRSTAEYRRLATGNLLGAWLGRLAEGRGR